MWWLRLLLYISVACKLGCIPKRDLPRHTVNNMHRGKSGLPYCSQFRVGNRVGTRLRVISIRSRYIILKVDGGGTLNLPCR